MTDWREECQNLSDEIERLRQENATLHEQVAALQSREVCTAPHDNVEECGYCQRDRLALRLSSVRETAEMGATTSQFTHARAACQKILDTIERESVICENRDPEFGRCQLPKGHRGDHVSAGNMWSSYGSAVEERGSKYVCEDECCTLAASHEIIVDDESLAGLYCEGHADGIVEHGEGRMRMREIPSHYYASADEGQETNDA